MGSVTIAFTWDYAAPRDEEFQPYFTQSFRKSYVCAKCDHHFKEGDGGGLIGGVAYCGRYGCYAEEMYERGKRRKRR